jgi:hypothetical protein
MVESMGIPGRRAAVLLGVAPSAVSQYLSGKRLSRSLPGVDGMAEARRIARRLAERLVDEGVGTPAPRLFLEGAAELAELAGRAPKADAGAMAEPGPPPVDRELAKRLRRRIAAEQATVADCMHLAQKARDELTRAIFRQIASDSLRHAEIVASLAQHLERGTSHTLSSGIAREDVEKLISTEQEAEDHAAMGLSGKIGGVMAVLAESMEADERKHEEILQGLLRSGFVEGAPVKKRR